MSETPNVSSRPMLDPQGRLARIPARELLDLFEGEPDEKVFRAGPGQLIDYTVGELRELATKGQAIDVPWHFPDPHGIWAVKS